MIAIGAISGAAIAGDTPGSGTVLRESAGPVSRSWARLWCALGDAVEPAAWGQAICGGTGSLGPCAGGALSLSMGAGCSFVPGGAVWTGSLSYQIGGRGCGCGSLGSLDKPLSLAEGCSFTRTVGPGTTRTPEGGGDTVSIDPNGGGITVACGAGGCGSQRAITISGMHLTAQGPRGQLKWDHTVTTSVPLQIEGQGAGRVIQAGEVQVRHNLRSFLSTTTVTTPLRHQASCCFPIEGSAKTVISGGGRKLDGRSESIGFGPACGQATVTWVDGSVAAVVLKDCL